MAGMKVNVPSKKVNNAILAASRCTLVFCTLPLTGATGVLSSPNYPDDYADYTNVKKMIQVEEGLGVSLQFTAFDIGFDEMGPGVKICFDTLDIEDGYDSNDFLLKTACGSSSDEILNLNTALNPPWESIGSNLPTFTTKRNSVVLTFNTDGDTSNGPQTGWSVNWSVGAPGECQPSLSYLPIIIYLKLVLKCVFSSFHLPG